MFGGLTKLASEGDEGGVRRLLDEGTPVDVIDNGRFNVTPLQVAARSGHLRVVGLLLEQGANVNHMDNDGLVAHPGFCKFPAAPGGVRA